METPGNPGLTKAREAAEACQGVVVIPSFQNMPTNGNPATDFNDLFVLEGAKVVHQQLQSPPSYTIEEWPEPIPLEGQSLPELPSWLLYIHIIYFGTCRSEYFSVNWIRSSRSIVNFRDSFLVIILR